MLTFLPGTHGCVCAYKCTCWFGENRAGILVCGSSVRLCFSVFRIAFCTTLLLSDLQDL